MWEIYLDNRIVDTYRGLKAVTVGGRGGGGGEGKDTRYSSYSRDVVLKHCSRLQEWSNARVSELRMGHRDST